MKNQVNESMNKIITLVHNRGQGGRTLGEINAAVARALAPAEINGEPTSLLEDPGQELEVEQVPAIDLEITQARAENERLELAADKAGSEMSTTGLSTIDPGAFAKLDALKQTIITEDELTPNARTALEEVKKDVSRAEEIITAVQENFITLTDQAIRANPDMAETLTTEIQIEEDPAAEQTERGTITEDPRTILDEAISDYVPVSLKHITPTGSRPAYGRTGQFLTTQSASLAQDPEERAAGNADIRALDTYFVLAFPKSTLGSAEDRSKMLLKYAVAQEPEYRQRLTAHIATAKENVNAPVR